MDAMNSWYETAWYSVVFGPLVTMIIMALVWFGCCRGSNRSALARKVLCEAACCWPCMWADVATRSKATGNGNAWCQVIGISTVWAAIVPLYVYLYLPYEKALADGDDAPLWKIAIWYSVLGLEALLYIIWSFERCGARRFIKRKADPTFSSEGNCTCDDGIADCLCVVLFPQQAAMQEAQFLDNLEAGSNPILLGMSERGMGQQMDQMREMDEQNKELRMAQQKAGKAQKQMREMDERKMDW